MRRLTRWNLLELRCDTCLDVCAVFLQTFDLALASQTAGRILVSDRAHLLFDLHKEVDGAREAELAVRGMIKCLCLSVLTLFHTHRVT